ncbi:hypothetical protein GYMLUDRAFT_61829 [Collybiopsis luxurians FD-317 M1]|uniref:Uncharacterized protein n=1 Tax=Collybiopsis luxurians FD-317 M1 TaxID=944289 RepID=A0A0D0CNF3_9AGAR|nr:hypothetical protein GYMLUDRAFT_61829 [Collybiopsis luxurians FD-317 M1]
MAARSSFHLYSSQDGYSKQNRYSLAGKLSGHIGAVLCLSATEDGSLLVSGVESSNSTGVDGLRIWDLATRKQLGAPSKAGSQGATTAVTWVSCSDDPDEAVFFGTQSGSLVCWRQLPGKSDVVEFEEKFDMPLAGSGEITDIAFDHTNNQLGVCNCTGVIQLYAINGDMSLSVLFSIAMQEIVPINIAFWKGGDRKLLVFSMYNRAVHELHADSTSHCLVEGVGMIGSAAADVVKSRYIIDDPSQGIALFRLNGGRLKTFTVKETKGWRPRQVTFADECRVVVSGSDHGIVYIFDRRSGQMVDELSLGSDSWVQTVTAIECHGRSSIAAARSGNIDDSNDIYIWTKQNTEQKPEDRVSGCGYLQKFLHVIMIVATVAFVIQNG